MGAGTISVVMATYQVATYLPEFLASIDAQRGNLSGVEFIFVDDGSPDDSAAIIDAWRNAHPRLTTQLVRQVNGGPSSARNAGLDVATGEWVTFCDPDDVLHEDYFATMTRFVRSPQADTVHIVAGRFIYLEDDRGTTSDTHPLRYRFSEGTRIWDLARQPHAIHVAANTGLYRRAVLDKYGLRFDPAVRPVWEDGHLTARYLSKFARPRIAALADAIYYYRRRSDGTSLMQGQWSDPRKFTDVPRLGWLDALRSAAAEHDGVVPPWIQNIVLYDVMGYFKQERRSPSPTALTPRAVSDEFLATLHEAMQYLDIDVIDAFQVTDPPMEVRQSLRLHFKGLDPRPAEIFLDELDEERGLVRLHWFYSGDAAVEEFRVRGFRVAPVYAKTRPCTFYGRTLAYERIVWLPADGTVAVRLDERPVPLRTGPVEIRRLTLTPQRVRGQLAVEAPAERPRAGTRSAVVRARTIAGELRGWLHRLRAPAERPRTKAQLVLRLARTPYYRLKYRDAWLLIDRDVQAQDNAEHLYRYLRAEHRRVNAWFVLDRSSPDWPRLEAEGFRLIEYGTREWRIALLNCDHLISSQIDNYVSSPLPVKLFGAEHAKTWRYTFLQHGVTKDDISIWINPKPIDLMITATRDEQRSIVDDSSPYVWSEREVRLTGFPRHDRLLSLARGPAGRDPRLILVMPTWRHDLVRHRLGAGNERAPRADFWTSEFAAQWRSVLESEQLRKLAADLGYRIVFAPHPNLQDYLDTSPLPEHVELRRFRDIDVQKTLVEGAALVTDYSSLAFEMAYLERPVVYFQFDRTQFFSGIQPFRRGSWSYEDDGFGPVTTDAENAVEQIAELMRRRCTPEPRYAQRMAAAFAFRDGQCSRRTYEAILDLTRPLKRAQRYRLLDPPAALEGSTVDDALDG